MKKTLYLTLILLICNCEQKPKQNFDNVANKEIVELKTANNFAIISFVSKKGTYVSEVIEIQGTISEDEKSVLIDSWQKKLQVNEFHSRNLEIFKSYKEASSKRAELIIRTTQDKESLEEDAPVIVQPSKDEKRAKLLSIYNQLNQLSKNHCIMRGNKEIDFDNETLMFYFGDVSYNVHDVTTSYEYRPNEQFGQHWLSIDCKKGNCIPAYNQYGSSSGDLVAFNSRESVYEFISLFRQLQNLL